MYSFTGTPTKCSNAGAVVIPAEHVQVLTTYEVNEPQPTSRKTVSPANFTFFLCGARVDNRAIIVNPFDFRGGS